MSIPIEQTAAITEATGVGAGALLTLLGGLVGHVITRQTRERELFQSSLAYLTGGTQKRSVGIALLRYYVESSMFRKKKKEMVIRIFLAQMRHLEDKGHHTDQASRRIELFNYRLMEETVSDWQD